MRIGPLLIPLALLLPAAHSANTLRHPHFPKKIEMSLGFTADADKLTLSHLTVTFDKEGFEQMAEGGAWHLGNAHLRTEADLKIGGQEVEYGNYRLLGRKAKEGNWELVLDPVGRDFTTDISADALTLATEFKRDQPVQEHLRIDVQPAGDAEHAALQLEVHFDRYAAFARIDLPK